MRRAYLCGDDRSTGENFDHRKPWIVSRLRFLSYVYSIDICAYAVMSNHYHVVLHVDVERAAQWSKEEVAERWMQLYNGHVLVDRWLASPSTVDVATMDKVDEFIDEWRKRLCDISWFMRGVNETIARMANEEEGCKGRFWEGRFKSQALLDEAAVLSCMAYVDLNPVRAGMANNLNESDFTSIQQRLFDFAQKKQQLKPSGALAKRVKKQLRLKEDIDVADQPEAPLMVFDGSSHTSVHCALPFTQEDYFDLVDKTGRVIREDKRGFINAAAPSIIAQYGIDPDQWIDHVKNFGRRYSLCAGSGEKILEYAEIFNRRWAKGVVAAGDVYCHSRAA